MRAVVCSPAVPMVKRDGCALILTSFALYFVTQLILGFFSEYPESNWLTNIPTWHCLFPTDALCSRGIGVLAERLHNNLVQHMREIRVLDRNVGIGGAIHLLGLEGRADLPLWP